MIRTCIYLKTDRDIADFVHQLNNDNSFDFYIIEDKSGLYRVDARSYLDIVYAFSKFTEFTEKVYLVNETEDGKFPNFIYEFRPLRSKDGNYTCINIFRFLVEQEMLKMGRTERDFRFIHNEAIINAIKQDRTPEELARTLLQ